VHAGSCEKQQKCSDIRLAGKLAAVGRLKRVEFLRGWVYVLAREKASLMQEWALANDKGGVRSDKFSWHAGRKYEVV
jgi:hypothetical protein